PAAGRLPLRTLNLDGDRQADLTVHGGTHKAVYCYPFEHYAYWSSALGAELSMAMFGENFTTEGLREDDIHLGDQLAIGTALTVVPQPRLPCFKLGIRFGSDAMVRRFLQARRPGFYLAVVREGEVGAGDAITIASRDPAAVSIADLLGLYLADRFDDDDAAL